MDWHEIRYGIGKKIIEIAVVGVMLGLLCFFGNKGNSLPRWVDWKSGTFPDASGQYEIILRHRTVKVIYDNSVIWKSSKDIKVQDVMSCDIDGDGADELILLCWKIGRFGTSRPFWVEEDEEAWSQHIFVYSYDEDKTKPKWMSSYIGVDVAEMSAADYGGVQTNATAKQGSDVDRETSAMTEQGSGNSRQTGDTTVRSRTVRNPLLLTDTDGKMSSWIWDSWGFTKEDTDITFVVFGDNLIHEPIYQYGLHNVPKSENNDNNNRNENGNRNSNSSRKRNNGFDFLFESKDIKKAIAASDVAVINQETPLTDDLLKYSGYPRFGTPMGVGEAIADAGFDVVTCATNHAFDQGVSGVDFTKNLFDSHDVLCIGIQAEDENEYRPYEVLVRNGVRLALLNYTYGTNGFAAPEEKSYMVHLLDDEARVRADIEKAGSEADFVVVFVHWGTEYEQKPDEFQQGWAQIFLESGVDVVVGTHPHVMQPYEVLQDESGHEMLVYYSVGNYVSAQAEQSCVKGGMAQFTVSLTSDGYKISEYSLQPLEITRQDGGKYTVSFLTEQKFPKKNIEEFVTAAYNIW